MPGYGIAEYSLHFSARDQNFAIQSHNEQMDALVSATCRALEASKVRGNDINALAIHTTRFSVISCWRRPAAHKAPRQSSGVEGAHSSEWGFAKLLHWLRNNPENRKRFVTALENRDMVVATLSGIVSVGGLAVLHLCSWKCGANYAISSRRSSTIPSGMSGWSATRSRR